MSSTTNTTTSVLSLIKTTAPKAPRITVYGVPGIGKSTLASQFPEPLFLSLEETGLSGIKSINNINDFMSLYNIVRELVELDDSELTFKTLVIDSLSKLDALVVNYILANERQSGKSDKKITLASACGGYGAGYQKAQEMHAVIKRLLDKLQDKGIAVVYIAHLDAKKYKAPDLEDYDRYTVTMNHDKSKEIYINDVDAVLFCRTECFTTDTESGRTLVKSSGRRIIHTNTNDAYIAKNRFNMPEIIDMSYNDLATHIPFFTNNETGEIK